MEQTSNVRVVETRRLPPPNRLKTELPLSQGGAGLVARHRLEIDDVMNGRDPRTLVIVGPCSIHDPDAALAYARELCTLRDELSDELLICMRVYFEKPRTTIGWKGLINDPHLDGRCDVDRGLRIARSLLLELCELEIPAASETLDPVAPQYIADLLSWTAIGARTTESQTHREMASGLSMPVGFKNGTDGGLDIAINAMHAAKAPHSFIGIDGDGNVCTVRTTGNTSCHAVLRGGSQGPNYEHEHVARASQRLRAAGLNPRVLLDCSHDNSGKNHERQPAVLSDVSKQIARGNDDILGVMIESHLVAGRQELRPDRPLVYGQSITDACIDLATTARILRELAVASRARRARHGRQMATGRATVERPQRQLS